MAKINYTFDILNTSGTIKLDLIDCSNNNLIYTTTLTNQVDGTITGFVDEVNLGGTYNNAVYHKWVVTDGTYTASSQCMPIACDVVFYELEECNSPNITYTTIIPDGGIGQRYQITAPDTIYFTYNGNTVVTSIEPIGYNANIVIVAGQLNCPTQV